MNNINNLSGKFGLYQWFYEYGVEYIHPEDVDNFSALMPNGLVFECIKDGDQYITLRYADKTYRVKRTFFKSIKEPEKKINERVILKGSGEKATVTDIKWHFKRNTHMYFIEINGKIKSKRYWAEDFLL